MKVLWVYSFICSSAKKVKMSHVLYVNRSYRKGSKLIKVEAQSRHTKRFKILKWYIEV